MEKICKQCGKKFHLTSEDIGFYRQKGWSIPERCEDCRRKNRANKTKYPNYRVTASHAEPSKISPIPIVLGIILIAIFVFVFRIFTATPSNEPLKSAETFVQETSPTTVIEIILETEPSTTEISIETTQPPPETTQAPETEKVTEEPKIITYYLNTYRMKFHKPDCPSVTEMNPRNRKAFYGTRDEAIEMGYSPCGNCRP